jgi:hypothetical protein
MAKCTLDFGTGKEIRELAGLKKQSLFVGGVAIAILLCMILTRVSLMAQPTSNHAVSNEPSQWKPSIKRPHPDWDYDGERILGHVGFDICLWDAKTGKLIYTLKDRKSVV